MAHRQSGSYKEEPGVAVAVPGDHVSVHFCHAAFCDTLVTAPSFLSCSCPARREFRLSSFDCPLSLPVSAAPADGKLPSTEQRRFGKGG
jgi:hypothetical protein